MYSVVIGESKRILGSIGLKGLQHCLICHFFLRVTQYWSVRLAVANNSDGLGLKYGLKLTDGFTELTMPTSATDDLTLCKQQGPPLRAFFNRFCSNWMVTCLDVLQY